MEPGKYIFDENGRVWYVTSRTRTLIAECQGAYNAERVAATLTFCAAYATEALTDGRLAIQQAPAHQD